MKISLLNFSHTSQRVGGVETRYSLLERVFKTAGHDVILLATSFMSEEKIQQCLLNADLVISDSAIGKISKCPMITVFGNPWSAVLRSQASPDIKDLLQRENRWHEEHDTYRVAVSDFMASEMALQGIIADKVIPNPADTDFFQASPTPKTPLILWIGSVAPIKNYAQIKKIESLWSKCYPNYQVQWRAVLKHVDGKNELNQSQMLQEYTRASLVVSTSHAEGCSNSLLEAVASDVPIIATQTGLFWNWWDKRLGIRVSSSNDTEGFLVAIRSILYSGQKYDPRQAAFDKGIDYKSWANNWQKLAVDVMERKL